MSPILHLIHILVLEFTTSYSELNVKYVTFTVLLHGYSKKKKTVQNSLQGKITCGVF